MKKRVVAILIILTVQFLLGMFLNLFGISPDEAAEQGIKEPLYSIIAMSLHSLCGLFLLIGSIFITVIAFRSRNIIWKKISLCGLLTTLVAFVAGIATVSFKDNASEISSFIMSVGFILSFISYGFLLKNIDS